MGIAYAKSSVSLGLDSFSEVDIGIILVLWVLDSGTVLRIRVLMRALIDVVRKRCCGGGRLCLGGCSFVDSSFPF